MWQFIVLLFGINILYISAQQCRTPNGEQARCLSIYNCKILLDVVNQNVRDPAQTTFLRDSVCGIVKDGVPKVCCGSDTRYKDLLPGRDQCGYQEDYKVLGGENADLTEFRWMALLERTQTSGQKSFACGGALISKRYVLTAAHCVTSTTSKVTSVRLGEWNLDTDKDCIGSGSFQSCSPTPQDVGIEQILPHEGYVRSNQGVFNDIALIRLATPVTFNKFVEPICLPLPSDRSNVGEFLHVAGWGATETKRYSPIKQKLRVPIVDLTTCRSKFSPHGININDQMICAGGEKGKDSCKGDSGGPLMAQSRNDTQLYYIEGIVSFGTICGTEGWPGIYTRVSDHLDWIKRNVKS